MKRFYLILLLLITCCSRGEDISGLYSKGIKEYNEKQFEEAEKTFLSVIEADDDFLNAYLMLAKIHYYNREYQKSIDALDEIVERDPDHAGALYWKARTLVMADDKDVDAPVKLLKRVVETDSSHIPARLLLSLLYEKRGEYREAIHEYITILGEEENLVSARGNLAILYMRLGLTGRAKDEVAKAQKIAEVSGCGVKNINLIKSEFDKWEEK